jgi:predicted permease
MALTWWHAPMHAFLRDIGTSLRALSRAKRYAFLAVACIALGLGANATMFGVADTLFFRPPAVVRDAGHVVRIYFEFNAPGAGQITSDLASYPLYAAFRDETKSFESVAAYQATTVSEGHGEHAEKLRAALVSASYFHLLGVSSATGRLWSPAESALGATPVAVISDGLWRRRFGRGTTAIGQSLRIAEREYTVVGVMPRGFTGVDLEPVDVWVPVEVAANDLIFGNYLSRRGAMAIALLGRLRPGVGRAEADADATIVHRNFMRTLHETDSTDHAVTSPLLRELGPKETEQAKVSVWLFGVAIAVLLIAGVNCTNLMLLRALRRRRELAVRISLGASPAHIARLLLLEGILLALVGAMAAIALALAGNRVLGTLLLQGDVTANFVDLPRLVVFTVVVAVTAGAMISLLPIWAVVRGDFTSDLRSGARAGNAVRSPARTALMVGQIALTTILLIGAGLFAKSLGNVRAADLGFDREGVLAVNIDFPGMSARPSAMPAAEALYPRMIATVSAIPGVSSVAVTTSVPFQYISSVAVSIPGRDQKSLPDASAGFTVASEGYLRTIGLRLKAGRWFEAQDYGTGGATVVVNETMAHSFWPNESAIGQCLVAGPPACRTVIGVVGDTRRTALREKPKAQVYISDVNDSATSARLPRTVLVRSAHPRAVASTVRRAIQESDPSLPFVTVRTLAELVEPQLRPWELGTTVFVLFGALALVLSAVGLYGTMSYAVSERTHEIGVRIALGARGVDVLRLLVGRGLLLTAAGILAGMGVALWGAPRIAAVLFGTDARDTGVFVIAAVTLAAAAAIACYSPARRATKVDPIGALKHE